MEQNRPTAATDAVSITTDAVTVVEPSPAMSRRPTWWRVNVRDMWAWIGIGAGALLIVEAIGLVIIGVVASS